MLSPAAAMRILRAHARADRRIADAIGRWLRNHHRAKPPKPSEFVMYDSVTVSAIPATAKAAAGYVNGRWPTITDGTLHKQCPHARLFSIAVTADADADCLDIENGDATPRQAPAWVRRQHARGGKRPAIYCSLSKAMIVRVILLAHGVRRSSYRIVTAHYTGRPHRCTIRCGFRFIGRADATQYTDRALGRNLDASLCAPDFFL